MGRDRRRRLSSTPSRRRSARNDRFLVVTHENPDGDALGSMLALTLGLRALGKDALCSSRGRAPLPAEYRFLSLAEVSATTRPPTWLSACCSPPTARTNGGSARTRTVVERCGTRRQHRPSPRQLSVRRHQSDRRRCLVDRRDRARHPARARRRAHTRDRRCALRRPGHRHGPVPVHEHDAEGAAARRRARRDRRRRARCLPARLRDGAVREAEAARTCARPGIALRRRPASSSPTCSRTTSPRSAPKSRTPKGIIDHLRSVEGSEMVALIREPPRARGAGPPDLAALEPRRGRRLGGGARDGRRRPPPGCRVLLRAARSTR